MSDRAGPFDAHSCLVAAGKKVLARARAEDAAFWLDCSAKTIHRMATCEADCDAQWSVARLVRLMQFEQEQLHTTTLAVELTGLIGGRTAPVGDAMLLRSDLLKTLRADAEVQVKIAEALADGQVSRREAAELLDEITRRRHDEEAHLIPDLVELVRSA